MLNYQIALTSVAFDNSYKNVLRFDTRAEQEAYFNVNTLFSNSPNVNFNVGSLIATNVIYDGNANESIGELLNKNYCIIKDNSPNATYKYYYYFVNNAMQDSDNRLKLSLELDIFQTYYIDLQFGECHIDKAHLNRFIDNGDGTVSFDGTVNSQLFEREEIKNVAKRLTQRTQININNHYPTQNNIIDEWLFNNIYAWIYLYLDPLHEYTVNEITTGSSVTQKLEQIKYKTKDLDNLNVIYNYNKLPSNIVCVCAPIYKTSNRITVDMSRSDGTTWSRVISYQGLENFLSQNNGYTYVYASKISSVPPFSNMEIDAGIVQSTGDLLITAEQSTTPPIINNLKMYTNNDIEGFFLVNTQDNQITSQSYTISNDITFAKSEIIGANKNSKYNPKLLNSDYKDLVITNSSVGDGFSYDVQKLNKKNFNLLITEAFTPDMAKMYARIDNSDNGVYIEATNNNYTGFVNTNDSSIIMPTSAYQTMLANNKNFFLQNSTNRAFNITQAGAGALTRISTGALMGGMKGGAMGALGGAVAGGVGALGAIVSSGLNYAQDKINENLTVDNLQNAPAKMDGARGNAVMEAMSSNYGIFVEEYDILPNEKEMINDYMCQYGFTYNRIDNIKNVDNIRKFYNFVRADIETINGANISERVHEKFRQVFAQGVRFWNTDTFNYDKENYERWLENG